MLERIEVAVRTKMIYYPSHEFHAHWFEDASLFSDPQMFKTNFYHIKKEVSRSKEQFIVHHRKTYRADQRLPPSWKTLEVISMGSLSKLYKALSTGECRDEIAIALGLPNVTFLESWLQTFTILRNICAHHSRLWNRSFRHVPKLLRKGQEGWLHEYGHDQKRLYIPLCCMVHTLRAITADRTIENDLIGLFAKYPTVRVTALGFPENWRNDPFWQ